MDYLADTGIDLTPKTLQPRPKINEPTTPLINDYTTDSKFVAPPAYVAPPAMKEINPLNNTGIGLPDPVPEPVVVPVDARGDTFKTIDSYKPAPAQPQRTSVLDMPSSKVQQQVARSVYDPNLLKEHTQASINLAQMTQKLKDAGTLPPENFQALIDLQLKQAENLDPTNSAGDVFKYQENANKTRADINKVREELVSLRDKAVDPDRYVKSLSPASKALSMIAGLAEAFLTATGKPPTKSYLDTLQNAIKDDINLQANELKRKGDSLADEFTMLQNELSMHGNELTAKLALETKLLEATRSKLATEAEKLQLTADQQYSADILDAQMNEKIYDNLLKMTVGNLTETSVPYSIDEGAIAAKEEIARKEIKDIEARTLKVPVIGDDNKIVKDPQTGETLYKQYVVSGTQERANSLKDTVTDANNMLQKMEMISNISMSYLDKVNPTSEDKAILQTSLKSLMLDAQQFNKLGVLSEADQAVLSEILGEDSNPLKVISHFKTKQDTYRDAIIQKVNLIVDSNASAPIDAYISNNYNDSVLLRNPVFSNFVNSKNNEVARTNQVRNVVASKQETDNARAVDDLTKGFKQTK